MPISGTVPVTSKIAPTDALDEYPTHDEQYGLGGYRSVASTTERDAITDDRRNEGMLVYCRDSGIRYRLGAGLTNADWTPDSSGGQKDSMRYYTDFQWNSAASQDGWLITSASGAWSMAAPTSSNRPGVIQLSTSTSSTANPNAIDNLSMMYLGGGAVAIEFGLRLNTAVPDVTDDYDVWFGLGDTTSGFAQTDGVYFFLDRTTHATDWQIAVAKAGSRTTGGTGVAASNGTWRRFRIEVNADATSVAFYIDGTQVSGSPLTGANIPNTSSNLLGKIMAMVKTAGTSARTVQVDYVELTQAFTTPR